MQPAKKDPNPYESPQVASDAKQDGLRITLAFVLALLLTGAVLLLIFFSRRPMLQLFADFDVELPMVTRIALGPVFLLIAGGLLVFTLAKEFVVPAKKWRRRLNLLACLAALLIGGTYAFFVGIVLVSLIQNLA